MNINKNILVIILGLFFAVSCEDVDDPIDGLETAPLFVQFGANTSETYEVTELSDPQEITIQVPQSFEQDMVAEISFEGTAVFGTDFTVTSDGLVSSSATGAFITIPFIPTDNSDLIADQRNFEINFLTDAIEDGDKNLTVTLVQAVGADDPSIVLDGGRGSIRKTFDVSIEDVSLVLSISPEDVTVIENSTDSVAVSVSLNYAAPENVTLTLGTFGNLTEGVDFEFVDFTTNIVLPAGETEAIFNIVSSDDNVIDDPFDSLGIAISSAAIGGTGLDLTVGEADSLIYFQEDEIKNITLVDAATDTLQLSENTEAGIKLFTVQMSDVSPVAVEIGYDINTVNATAGVDYNDISSGSVTFNPGQTEVDILIEVLANGFSSMDDVIITISLDDGSLITTDDEVTVEEDQSTAIKINN